MYKYMGRTLTREDLGELVQREADETTDEPERVWRGGEFDFNDWLIEALDVGLVEPVS